MNSLVLWKSVLEIGFIWVLIYSLIRFLQGTRAVQVLMGLVILMILFNVAKILELSTINWVLTKLFAVGEESETLEEIYEPYLIQKGFLKRTPSGRVLTKLAYTPFGVEPGKRQKELW